MEKELTKFEKEMQKVLLKQRAELLNNIKMREQNNNSVSSSDNSSKDDADIMSAELEAIKESSMRSYEVNRLKALENALGRISQGSYGKCMKCGKKITQERLRAIPWALLCIDCKNETEARNIRLKQVNESQKNSEYEKMLSGDYDEEDDEDKDD